MPQDDRSTLSRSLETRTRSALAAAVVSSETWVPGLTILCHPQIERIGERVALPELLSGRQVILSRLEPLFAAPGSHQRRPLADPFLSRHGARLVSADGGLRLEIGGSGIRILLSQADLGTAAERSSGEVRCSAAELQYGIVLVLAQRVTLLLHRLPPSPPRPPTYGMVGESPGMIEVRRQIGQLADLTPPLLIRGETGTGKELVAGAVHRAGRRAGGPFLALNMGAMAPSLVASELFGVAKGAFTGADRQRSGHFVAADGGTLFLDEIGEAPAEVQVALLRTLETGEAQAVGSGKPRRVDVRVVTATDADLDAMMAEGTFRKALLHRLSAYEIELPPLRARRDDIGRLLLAFLRQELTKVGCEQRLDEPNRDSRPWLSADLTAALAVAPWPGNVRQLRNVARQMVASCREQPEASLTPAIERQLQPPSTVPSGLRQPAEEKPTRRQSAFRRPEDVKEDELLAALRQHRFRLQQAAAQLGISRASLYRLIDRFPSVRKPGDLERDEIVASFDRCGGDLEAMVDELHVSRKGLRRRMTELKIAALKSTTAE